MRASYLPLLACLALSGSAAVAQTPPPMPAMKPINNTMMPNREQMMAHMRERMKDMCESRYAAEVGHMAFIEAKLNLTPAQESEFNRWKGVKLSMVKAKTGDCTPKDHDDHMGPPSMIDRMTREEDMLKHRLADLQAEKPALEAFYNSLTADQKKSLDHPMMMMGMMGGHGMGHGMEHGMMGHMGHGMEHGP